MTVESPDYLGLKTEPDRVEADLRALWQENDTATRASLMNLVIYSESPHALQENTACVEVLTLEHACRVLLIEARWDSPDRHTEAWIRAHCSLGPDGRKAVCCEQVAFRMHGHSPARLTNLLFANLESDLPLTLWWQAPINAHFESRIYSRVDRLLIDSQTWDDPTAEFERLNAAYQNRTQAFVIHDLNWTRTFHLRLAIAGGFENPQAIAALAGLQRIEITHAPGHATTAQLLAGWLSERLAQRENAPTPVLVREETALSWPIGRVQFQTSGPTLAIERSNPRFYSWDRGKAGETGIPRLFPADPIEQSALLMDQLSRGGHTAAYLRVARRACGND